MEVGNRKNWVDIHIQTYAYQNKEQVFITIRAFVSTTGQVVVNGIITIFFHYLSHNPFAFNKLLGYSWLLDWWGDPYLHF